MQELRPAGHLPFQPTSFVGRRQELSALSTLLSSPERRLLTLIGTGGIGKTRLALEVAARLRDEYPDGVHLVELAGVSDPELVTRAVLAVLGLMDEANRSGLETLAATLSDKRLLLILDNCEHLLDACAELAHGLLTSCPYLYMLATSREPLHTAGEVVWEVSPLSLPALEQLPAANDLVEADAVALFVDRATRVLPTFELTGENAPLVARVCHRLDGVPLSIELAAVRIRVLSVGQILQRLDDALRLLTRGDRLAPARQQTLRATLDWSYELLTISEQHLLQRLSVFAGGFSLAAAGAICAGDGLERVGILDLLSRLVDKSLVVAERTVDQSRRFRLLETIRAYAGEKLAARDAGGQWRDRHLLWYLDFAERVHPQESWGVADPGALDRLDLERGNLRGALRWAIDSGRSEEAHRLAVAMAWYWHRRAHFHEGSQWLDRILALPREVEAQVCVFALTAAGSFAQMQGDLRRAIVLNQEAVDLGREAGCLAAAAWSLHRLAHAAYHEGDDELADARLAESLEVFGEAGQVDGVATTLSCQADFAIRRGDYRRAKALCRVSLPIFRELGDVLGIVGILNDLAAVARHQGELQEATELLHEALRLGHEEGTRLELILCLKDLACVACDQNLPERAARLFGASEALRQVAGASWARWDIDQDVLLVTRASLGDSAFEATVAAGREMTLEQVVQFALSDSPGHQPGVEPDGPAAQAWTLRPPQPEKRTCGGLTPRQREVAALIARGMSNRAIAEELVITVRTVESHVTHILRKLGFGSRAEVAGWAVDRGMVSPPRSLEDQMRAPVDRQQP
jgi:non-specific serine/threonine protein kinase